jgi:hypothetical protein
VVISSSYTNGIKFYNTAGTNTGTVYADPSGNGFYIGASDSISMTAPLDVSGSVSATNINAMTSVSSLHSMNIGTAYPGIYFSLNSTGNITKLNNITYSFPSVAPTLNQVLTCTNATGGVLGWSTPTVYGDTISPATNTDNYVPLWNGTNSKTLKDGLAFTSLATASTIVSRDGSANSYFKNLYVGIASTYTGAYFFYDSGDAYTAYLSRSAGQAGNIGFYLPTTGGTLLTNNRTLTINGTAYDLSANRTWTVGDATLAGTNSWTGENSFTKFKLNAEVSHSVTGTGNYDCTDKNVIILTPTAAGYVASLTGLSINRPILVLNGSGTYTVTVNSTTGGKLLGFYGTAWIMYNGTTTVTYVL